MLEIQIFSQPTNLLAKKQQKKGAESAPSIQIQI